MINKILCFLFNHRNPFRRFNRSIKIIFKKDSIYHRCNYCRKYTKSISWSEYKDQNPQSISKSTWEGYIDRIYKNIK